jgi:D-alanyl-D-alanine carboxypeptidase
MTKAATDRLAERLAGRTADLARAYGAPGVQIALTDRGGTILSTSWGHRDQAARLPVSRDTLFQIGSIGKSFTAACLMQLAEEGRLDLDAPVAEYLPWFEVRSAFGPITIHHLMNHTAGIITGSDITSDSPFDVWALRDTEAGAPPGERWQYSNIGYRVLGFVLEELERRPYADIVRARVLEPAGMPATEPVITNDIRDRLAVGYSRHPDDRPLPYDAPLQPATWLETATGDGSLASTAEDMAAYLRAWLNRGQGDAGTVVSDASFDRMTRDGAAPAEEGRRYGYGLAVRTIEGRSYLGHGGGMVGYASAMVGEPETGFGAVVMTNCIDWEDWTITLARDTLGWLRSEAEGRPLPPPEPAPDPLLVERADDYAARYHGPRGTLDVMADGSRLFVEHGGDRIRLARRPDDRFLAEHPDFELYLLGFERREGAVVAAVHGPDRWIREDRGGAMTSTSNQEDGASIFIGHYRSNNPWTTNFRVVHRDGQLLLIYPDGIEEALVRLRDGHFRVGEDPGCPERLVFDAVVDGHALRATLSGCPYFRTFTP